MNKTALIHGLARSGLSAPLAHRATQWHTTTPTREVPADNKRDWVRYVSDIAWQACVRDRHGQCRLAVLRNVRRPDLLLDRNEFVPGTRFSRDYLESMLLRALVAAAISGGQLDEADRQVVLERLCRDNLCAEHRALLIHEVREPVSIRRLAHRGPDTPAAAMIYVVSLMAVDATEASATLYLTALADALGLDASLVAQIHHLVDRDAGQSPLDRLNASYRVEHAIAS